VKCGGNGATRQFCRDAIRALPAADPLADPRVQALVEALKPFARHVDKQTCKITMIWQDGEYNSTYTETLKPQDFFAAHAALAAFIGDEA
jgi:hypothetical protein